MSLTSDAKLYNYLRIDNFFSEEELFGIWKEIDFAHDNQWFSSGDLGEQIKAGANKTLDEFVARKGFCFNDRYDISRSITYKAVSRIFSEGVTCKFAELSFACRSVLSTKNSQLLCTLYTNGDFYKAHTDMFNTTVLFWLAREPGSFKGGDLKLPEISETIKFSHNTMIMFPSQAIHSVTKVAMDPDKPKKLGRYCLSFFLN